MSEYHVIAITAAVFFAWCFIRQQQMGHYYDKPQFVVDWFPSVSLTHRADEKNCHVSRVKLLKKDHPLDPDYIEFGREGFFGRKFVDFVLEKKTTNWRSLAIGIRITEQHSEYSRKRYYFEPGEVSFFWPDITTCRDLLFWNNVLSTVASLEFGKVIYRTGPYSDAYAISPITESMPHLVKKARKVLSAVEKS